MITMLRCEPGRLPNVDLGGVDGMLPGDRPSRRFATGRGALAALLGVLDPPAGAVVAMPAYVAEGVLSPCSAAGVPAQFYRLDRDLRPNRDDVEAILDSHDVCLFVFVHFFGFDGDRPAVRRMLNDRDVPVLDDLAHALFDFERTGARDAGGNGYLLYSLNKFLPVTDGAVLMGGGEAVLPAAPETPIPAEAVAHYQRHLELNAEVLAATDNAAAAAALERSGEAYERYYTLINRQPVPAWSQSASARARERAVDLKAMQKIRQRHAVRLYDGLAAPLVTLLHGALPVGLAPFCVPAMVPSGQRDRIVDACREQGLLPSTLVDKWDFRGRDPDPSRFTVEADFIDRHILIPVNEFLGDKDVERMIGILNQLS